MKQKTRFRGLCRALARFDTTGAQSATVIFYDATLDPKDFEQWVKLLTVSIGKQRFLQSDWDEILHRLPYYAREYGSFAIDTDRIPIGKSVPSVEARRINLQLLLKDIDQLKRIYAVLYIKDELGYAYAVFFSSDTGLPDVQVIRYDPDFGPGLKGKSEHSEPMSNEYRRALSSFEMVKNLF